MGLTGGVKPTFRLFANEADITGTLQSRLISLRYTDASGYESDVLEIVISDADPNAPVAEPPTGAEMVLFLGYDGLAQKMGEFVCDEIEMSGWPGEMTIRARSAVFDKSKKGKTGLQSQKSRSWPKDTKLGDMVSKIAKEHGLTPKVSESLKTIKLPHIAQTDESDLNFLVRVGRKYDGFVKPVGQYLIFAKRGESKSVSGEELPPVALTPSMVSRYRVVTSSRETAGMVVAYWHAVKNAKRHEVKVGEGEPVTRLKMYYPTQEMALAAARSELDRRKRKKTTVSIQLPGRPDLAAEAKLVLAGFRPGVDGEWIITRVEHSLGSSGYVCQVEAETPNDSDTPNSEDTTDDPDQ